MISHKIIEIHEMIGKMKHGLEIDDNHFRQIMSEVLRDGSNAGTWIRREKNYFENYVSVVKIFKDRFGGLKATGFRMEHKAFKR